MQPILTVAEMNAVDGRALETTALDELVGRAGAAVARTAMDMLGGSYGRRVVVVAGRGNNGADGREAARLLTRRGARVRVVEAGTVERIGPTDLLIDAAYGTGFRGEYLAPQVLPGTPVLAVDIPSGVEGDTGRASGTPTPATRTVTFVALKPGLLQGDGIRLSGTVELAPIGLDPGEPDAALVGDADVADLFPERSKESNKWSAAVLVVAGSPGMAGAAALCARSAYRAGAGMVRLGVPGGDPGAGPASEAVGIALPAQGWADAALEEAARCSAVVVGPGLGRSPSLAVDVRRLVAESAVPVVVDADGLFALGRLDRAPLGSRATAVLTPHDGEYDLLTGGRPGPDRFAAARRLSAAGRCVALVKGSTTAVSDPDGRVLVCTSGSPRLATAGTGDVLSGMIGAMIARGVPPHQAAGLAAHVHGRAAQSGPVEGLVAGDLPDLVSAVLSRWRGLVAGSETRG